MSKKTVPESVPTFVHVSEKSNAATISQEVAHLLMDTVQRNNQIMENVSLELSAIGKNITENPADTMEEVRRVADVLLEYRKWNDTLIQMILEILENPIDRKTPTKNKSIELENLLNELEKKFHSQVRAFSSAVTTKKKYIHWSKSLNREEIPGEIFLKELKQIQQSIMELRFSMRELEKQAMTDGLTGLLNRIHIQEYIHSEVERFGRYNLAASLIFLDIDHFKEINDTHGHNTGDKVLQKFSNILQENIRNTDFAGRWGGEEFILLLPNTDVVQARIFAEKLRKKIEDSDTDDIITITASLGVSQIEIGESWETWVKRTDAAMYRAKSNGRNRVETDYGNTEWSISITPTKNFVKLHWHETYNCGNPIIDWQHRWLFEGVNSLINAMMNRTPLVEMTECISTLLWDVIQHFHDEEKILLDIWYWEIEEQQKSHTKLIAEALELIQHVNSDENILWKCFQFLAYTVIAQHLLSEDRKFFPIICQTGKK